MSKKKKYIQYPKERAILSDVLPYEIPITFSNRYLYRFLVENNICLDNEKIVFNNDFVGDDLIAFKEILKILFHHQYDNNEEYKFRKIPLTYRITHKEKDFRELALIHPINQLKLIKLYEDFKESILYSCSISNFSVRKPVQVAKFSFFNDKLHQLNKGDKNDFLELNGREYENLKTFFSYKKYTNIYKFHEDYRYHRAEKKYNFLFKFDISKCFDSIYTHSISWAVLGLDTVKENVDASKKNFSGIFDKFIQYSNYGETNGILIGPEFSRIFAEIILQRIDKTVEEKIKLKGFINRIDYELYRYVDDYFLFCDDDLLKEEIFKIFKHELKGMRPSNSINPLNPD
ncbi:antiviral reverse transcriptase Drt3b [Flavobacterium sp. XS2P39]|uniref:antiviral reverse transcriptase Drt3b n=1 Tax=Flavobacterium sp. XS2P39 TaxID=3401725 RepID=UPI003AACBDAB